jgi:hypothetical protein
MMRAPERDWTVLDIAFFVLIFGQLEQRAAYPSRSYSAATRSR